MKLGRMCYVAAAVLLGASTGAAAAGVDLAVTDVQVAMVGGDLQMTAEVTVVDVGLLEPVTTDLRFYLDTQAVAAEPFTAVVSVPSSCPLFSPPNCGYGYCEPMTINGQPTASGCIEVNFQGPGCGCIYLVMSQPHATSYHGEETCIVMIDQEGAVAEEDETNNAFTVSLAPVAEQAASWSALKASFR